jgi:hypothetical protein
MAVAEITYKGNFGGGYQRVPTLRIDMLQHRVLNMDAFLSPLEDPEGRYMRNGKTYDVEDDSFLRIDNGNYSNNISSVNFLRGWGFVDRTGDLQSFD